MSLSNEPRTSANANQGGIIPADEGDAYKSWSLPDVNAETVIPSAEKIRRDKKNIEAEKKLNDTADNESIETIDNVEVQPHTAEQLKEIAEAAEKEGYDSGYEKGLLKGKEEGYQSGMDAAKSKIACDTEHLHNLIEALLIPLDIEQKQLEQFILKTIKQIAEIVIQRELLTDSAIIHDVVKSVLQIIPNPDEKLTLYLNPQDIDLLTPASSTASKQHLYQADSTLLPGGCRLESHETRIDASIEQRMAQVFDDFLHQRYTADGDTDMDDSDDIILEEARASTEDIAVHDLVDHTAMNEAPDAVISDDHSSAAELHDKPVDNDHILDSDKGEPSQ